MKLFTTLFISILFAAVGFNSMAQDEKIYQPKPIVDIRGDEIVLKVDESNNTKIKIVSSAIGKNLSGEGT